ncbi:MAG: phage antirepressor [Phascolarctobacterium sp.]
MNNIKIFENPEFGSIRTVEINNEPWFVGKDVAEALGYGNGKSLANAVANHVDDADKGVTEMMTPGGNQKMTIINESGLYSLILSSKLPKAKEFKRWVTSEVLPAIRKHGGYLTAEKIEEVLSDPDTIIKLATNLKEEQAKRREAEAALNEAKPKIIFADAVSASDQTILIGDLAKIIKQNGHDIGQKRLFQWLRDNGYLIKRQGADYNSPTQRAMEMGLFRIKETAVTHADGHVTVSKTVKVTGRGQNYFVNKFAQVEQKG